MVGIPAAWHSGRLLVARGVLVELDERSGVEFGLLQELGWRLEVLEEVGPVSFVLLALPVLFHNVKLVKLNFKKTYRILSLHSSAG